MPDAGIIELGDLELTKHARAQLRDYFEDLELEEVDRATDIPYKLEKMLDSTEGVILLVDSTDQRFMDSVVKEILEIEREKSRPVQKLLLEKGNESEQNYRKRAQESAREDAEKLAGKIKNLGGKK